MAGLVVSLIALVAWASAASGSVEATERITAAMAVERATKCGLGPVSARYDDELQSAILSVPHAASATQPQLKCLDDAAGFGIFVELPSGVQHRFDALRQARASVMMKAEAREWLAKRGVLERVPKYVPGTTDEAAFTRKVEDLCGPLTKGAFQSQHGPHVLSPEWTRKLGMPLSDEGMDAFSCLLNVLTVAGYEVGFIGNEAYRH